MMILLGTQLTVPQSVDLQQRLDFVVLLLSADLPKVKVFQTIHNCHAILKIIKMIEKNRNPFLIYEIFSRSEFVLIVTNGAVGIFGLSGSFWDQSQILSSFWTAKINVFPLFIRSTHHLPIKRTLSKG